MDSPIWNNLFHRTFSQRTHFQNKICFLKILFKVISFILPLHKFSTCLTVLNDPTSEMYLVRCSLSLNCIFPFDFFTVLAFSGLLILNKLISSFVFFNFFYSVIFVFSDNFHYFLICSLDLLVNEPYQQ